MRVCNEPGCPELVEDGATCAEHKREPWKPGAGMPRRKPLPGKVRRGVLREHGGVCHVCGQPGARVVDHVKPVAEGGTDDPSNLRPIHAEPCHRRKTAAESQRGRRRARDGAPSPDATTSPPARPPYRTASPGLR
jgi:5-methylcytosine-specific restriction endonuclease McrA